jgi:hypothetical protein
MHGVCRQKLDLSQMVRSSPHCLPITRKTSLLSLGWVVAGVDGEFRLSRLPTSLPLSSLHEMVMKLVMRDSTFEAPEQTHAPLVHCVTRCVWHPFDARCSVLAFHCGRRAA